jgi:hypothetical protein
MMQVPTTPLQTIMMTENTHDDREHGLARQRRLAVTRQHDRQDKRHFDHSDCDGEYQGAVWLAGAMGDDVGMMDAGEHDAEQHNEPDEGQQGRQHGRRCRGRRDCRSGHCNDETNRRDRPP